MRSATKKRTGKDDAYIAWLHTLPCICCELLRLRLIEAGQADEDSKVQTAKTEAAHVGIHGLSVKSPDREAIPLCGVTPHMDRPADGHHQEGLTSAHKLQTKFWTYWGLDRETVIFALNSKYQDETGREVLGGMELFA